MLHPNNIFLYLEKIIKIKIKNPVLIIDTKVQLAIFFLKKRLPYLLGLYANPLAEN